MSVYVNLHAHRGGGGREWLVCVTFLNLRSLCFEVGSFLNVGSAVHVLNTLLKYFACSCVYVHLCVPVYAMACVKIRVGCVLFLP